MQSNNKEAVTESELAAVRPTLRRLLRLSGAICAVALAIGPAYANTPAPTSWEVGGEFDDGNNPSGVWSYGWSSTLSNFFLDQAPLVAGGNSELKGYSKSPTQYFPVIAHNTLMVPWYFQQVNITYPSRAVILHPGYACEYATLRFTAPSANYYRISGQFYALDGAADTKVYIRQTVAGNNFPLFAGAINAGANVNLSSFTTHVSRYLNVGDSIDFKVGCAPGQTNNGDSTGLHAVIQIK